MLTTILEVAALLAVIIVPMAGPKKKKTKRQLSTQMLPTHIMLLTKMATWLNCMAASYHATNIDLLIILN